MRYLENDAFLENFVNKEKSCLSSDKEYGSIRSVYSVYNIFFIQTHIYTHTYTRFRVMTNFAYSNTRLLEMLLIVWAQVRLSKERKKGDKIVSDSQERAFWRVYRPPPGCLSSLEVVPVPTRFRPGLPRPPSRKRTLTDLQREVRTASIDFMRARARAAYYIPV